MNKDGEVVSVDYKMNIAYKYFIGRNNVGKKALVLYLKGGLLNESNQQDKALPYYIKAAEEIMQIEQQVENYINNLTTLKTGHLSVGASNLFAAYVLPSLITKFKESYPDIDIQLTEGNTTQLELMLSNNSIVDPP